MAFKKYKEDITAADAKLFLSRAARDMVSALENGMNIFEQWEAFKQGRSDGDIETDLGISAEEVTDIKQGFSTLESLFLIANGDNTVTIPTGTSTKFFRRLREFA